MGTRSLTTFQDGDIEIAVMYKQYDGYPTGHGQDLKEFLQGFEITNGIHQDASLRTANGMECLAAQVVAHFKNEAGVGNIYLMRSGVRDCGEEYIYILSNKEGKVWLTLKAGAVTMFGLPGSKEKSMPSLYDGLITDFDPVTVENEWAEMPAPKNDFLDSEHSPAADVKG